MAWLAIPVVRVFEAEGPVLFLGAVFAAMSAVYSAFLFRQARGRVFWHSTLTPLHLLVQAMVAGAAVLMLVAVAGSIISGNRVDWAGRAVLYYEFFGAPVANRWVLARGRF